MQKDDILLPCYAGLLPDFSKGLVSNHMQQCGGTAPNADKNFNIGCPINGFNLKE